MFLKPTVVGFCCFYLIILIVIIFVNLLTKGFLILLYNYLLYKFFIKTFIYGLKKHLELLVLRWSCTITNQLINSLVVEYRAFASETMFESLKFQLILLFQHYMHLKIHLSLLFLHVYILLNILF